MRGIKKVSAFAVLLTFVFTYLHFRSSEKKSEPEIILGDGYAAGDNDKPYARYEYERMMLMDPATGEIPAGIRERELEFATLLPSVDDDASRSSISWTNRGPWNVGGMTRALAMDVNNENVMIAGTNSGSLWRTTDGGTTWAETTPKNVYHGITCLAQDKRPGHSNVWYYGSGDPWASASGNSSSYYTGTGMYKSLDSGMTWTSLPSTATGNLQTFDNVWDIIYRIVPDKSNTVQDVVYAATYGCIFRSVDGGNAWTLVRGGSASSPYFTNVELTSTGIVYATLSSDGLHAGIWRSVDGINYVSILPAGFPATFDRMVSAIAPSNENIVYFICNTPGFGTPDTNFLGTVEWNSLWKYTYLSGDVSGNDGGMFRTDNCLDSLVTWTSLDNGYLTAMFYTVALDHATANSNVIIGGTQDNGTWYTRSTNSTSPWTHPGGGDGSFCYVANNESAFYTSVQNGKVYRGFLDTTGAVTAFSRIDPIGGHGYLFVNPFTIDPNNNNRMYLAGGSALWRNNDLSGIPMNNTFDSISTNWFMVPDTLTTAGIKITALAVSNIPANRLYVGTNKGKVYRINNANTDTAVFTNITSTTPNAVFPSNGYVSCVAVDPSHADNVIVVFSNYSVYSLFYTNNGGTSWKKIAGNLEQFSSGGGNGPSCRWASIMPVTNGNVYLVGTSICLYATKFLYSINTVWYQQGANTIGRTVVPMLDTRFSDGIVAVATHANGIYTASVLDFNDVVGISQKENAVLNISASAFPNPSSDVVFIRYQSKQSGDVELNIMDNNGRLVKRIIPGNKDAGRHEVSLDASSLKTGLYFAVLKSSYGESAVTKFVVTR